MLSPPYIRYYLIIIFKDSFSYHIYADDILIYFTASCFDSSESLSSKKSHCLKALSRLKLNDDKT